MPSYEATASGMMYQFFPGELFTQGKESVDVAGLHSAICIPADFYTNPEYHYFREDSYFPTHAVEIRPIPFLYMYKRDSGKGLYPELDPSSSNAVYYAPRTWLDTIVYNFISAAAPGETETYPAAHSQNLVNTLIRM